MRHFTQSILDTGFVSLIHETRKLTAILVIVGILCDQNSHTPKFICPAFTACKCSSNCYHFREVEYRQHGSCEANCMVKINGLSMKNCQPTAGNFCCEQQFIIAAWAGWLPKARLRRVILRVVLDNTEDQLLSQRTICQWLIKQTLTFCNFCFGNECDCFLCHFSLLLSAGNNKRRQSIIICHS